MRKKSLSFIIPAFNEEHNLERVVEKIDSIAPRYCYNYEIIIVNDGSTDGTRKIADGLAKRNNNVRVFHNKKNQGMGFSYKKGLAKARHEYVMINFGDDDHPVRSLAKIISKAGRTDIIIPYYTNFHLTKTWFRHLLSVTYTRLVNTITGLTIRYYNGVTLHRTSLVRKIGDLSTSFGFQAEIIVHLIKDGATYLEVAVENENRKTGSSAALRPGNIYEVCLSIIRLYKKYRSTIGTYTDLVARKSYDDKYEQRAFWYRYIWPLGYNVRADIHRLFFKNLSPSSKQSVLDLGVTDKMVNSFHLSYPFREKITAAGLAKRNKLIEEHFPEIKYRQISENPPYLFEDNQFDIVHASAVIEHVGNRQRQGKFLKEAVRIGKSGMVSTPNRWYPVELHTYLPLVHWLPTELYRKIFAILGMKIWSKEENLNLLSLSDLKGMINKTGAQKYWIVKKRTFGFVSNFMLFWEK